MAPTPLPLLFFTISLLASPFLTLSRHSSSSQILDVTASLHAASHALNPRAIPSKHHSLVSNSTRFSLELHSRDSLFRHVLNLTHQDYASLVLSRLHRDSSRVTALSSKLALSLSGVSKADLTPLESDFRVEDLSTPVLSGVSQGSGEYFSRIGIGTPVRQFYMVLDTGSDINWIQCNPCSDCYQQSDPIFDPSSSSTYSPLSCGSAQCSSLDVSACRAGRCLYQVSYGDGSYTVGDLASDTFTLGSSSVPRIALGCGHDNEGLFVGAAGLLGLGGGPLSLTSQIKASSFSYCLVDRDSSKSSTLDFNSPPRSGGGGGGARPPPPPPPPPRGGGAGGGDSVTAPISRNGKVDTFYYVGLTGMSVGGRMLSVPSSLFQMDGSGNGGTIVDCGTAITRLPTDAYNSLRDEFARLTADLRPTTGVALFDTCYDLSSQSSVRVPTVAFHFGGGKAWNLPAKNYLIPVDSSGTFCFAFAPTTSPMSIIGNVQQQGTRVTYDLANSQVGFSTNQC